MTPETTHNWFSSVKVISATLLCMLEHESKADLAKPVFLLPASTKVVCDSRKGVRGDILANGISCPGCSLPHFAVRFRGRRRGVRMGCPF
jgi:hypothetical protein